MEGCTCVCVTDDGVHWLAGLSALLGEAFKGWLVQWRSIKLLRKAFRVLAFN